MRTELGKVDSLTRHRFYGTFERFGEKRGYRFMERTVLLKDIKDENGNLLTDHLWFNYTKGFSKINLQQGCVVEFFARVDTYEKGYFGYRDDIYYPPCVDYKLSRPTKIKLVV